MAVAALVDEDHTTVHGEVVHHEGEIVGRTGKAVDQHQRRCIGAAVAALGPCQLDPVDGERLRGRLCHEPLFSG
jgi:hypothetical protein